MLQHLLLVHLYEENTCNILCNRHMSLDNLSHTADSGESPRRFANITYTRHEVAPYYFNVRTLLCTPKILSDRKVYRRKVTMGKLLGRLPGEIYRLLEGRPV